MDEKKINQHHGTNTFCRSHILKSVAQSKEKFLGEMWSLAPCSLPFWKGFIYLDPYFFLIHDVIHIFLLQIIA